MKCFYELYLPVSLPPRGCSGEVHPAGMFQGVSQAGKFQGLSRQVLTLAVSLAWMGYSGLMLQAGGCFTGLLNFMSIKILFLRWFAFNK